VGDKNQNDWQQDAREKEWDGARAKGYACTCRTINYAGSGEAVRQSAKRCTVNIVFRDNPIKVLEAVESTLQLPIFLLCDTI